MLQKITSTTMGSSNLGWLQSLFHFSFADYYNPENMNFGPLRVINDDLVAPGTGFDKHPHKDMEIISYVVKGALTHADSMGNRHTITRGQVQYMSAGTGVFHSEHNLGKETTRLLQIWVIPDAKNHVPNYGDYSFPWHERKDRWLPIASGQDGDAPIKIHQDVHIYATELSAGTPLSFEVPSGRQAYLVQVEGQANINGLTLNERDALESVEESLTITAVTDSHLLVIEMAKG